MSLSGSEEFDRCPTENRACSNPPIPGTLGTSSSIDAMIGLELVGLAGDPVNSPAR